MAQHENMMVTEDVRLQHQLGQGGMGTLWVGYDTRLDRQVAVKFITPEVLERSPGLKERFRREAQAAAGIRSPYVVQIHAHGELPDGSPYMVMELLEGESLGEFLGSGRRLTYEQAGVLLGQVAKALGAAHKVGLVHRDIKPDNVFMLKDEDLFVKLLDFGIAKHSTLPESASNLTATGSVLGTPHYMSPEQLLDTKGVDHRADLWALGVVGYIMVTGELPFVGDTLAATIVAITSHSYAPPSTKGAPPAFDAWFSRVFHREIEHRFPSAKSMSEAFSAACKQQAAAPALTPPTAHFTQPGAPYAPPEQQAWTSQPAVEPAARPATTIPSQPPGAPDPRRPSLPPNAAVTVPETPHTAATVPNPPSMGLPPGAGLTAVTPVPMIHHAPAGNRASAPPMPQTFGGASSTLSGEKKKSSAPMVVGSLVLLLLVATGVGAFLYTRDDADPPERANDKSSAGKPGAKPKTSGKVPTPPAPEGMVAVAANEHSIGCDPKQHQRCFSDEQPQHKAKLGAFAIMIHEVTMGDYDECVANDKCPPAGTDAQCNWQRDGHEKHPMNCVTQKAAEAFCASKGWRLPTEIEWEAAARPASDAHRFPWGEAAPSCDLAVMKSNKPGCGSGETMPVGSRPKDRSHVGALDMGGSVREWTSSTYAAYPGGSIDKTRSGAVNRGGSFLMDAEELTSVFTRGVDPPTESRPGIGFRCAVDL